MRIVRMRMRMARVGAGGLTRGSPRCLGWGSWGWRLPSVYYHCNSAVSWEVSGLGFGREAFFFVNGMGIWHAIQGIGAVSAFSF